MGEFLRYFRQHPWHRRLITLSLAGIVAMALTWVYYPGVRNRRAIEALFDPDSAKRAKAFTEAVDMARWYDDFREALEEALDTDDDPRFTVIADVLVKAELFHTDSRRSDQLDRFERIQFGRSQPPGGVAMPTTAPTLSERAAALDRRTVVHDFILRDRHEAETAKLLLLAVADPAACVRRKAGLLAVKLGHTAGIEALLADPDPTVRAWLTIDLALAGRSAFTGAMAERLATVDDPFELSCVAWAMAKLDGKAAAAAVAAKLAATEPGPLQERLLWVATMLPAESIGPTVRDVMAANTAAGAPLRMAILAAGRLKLSDRQVHQIIGEALAVTDKADIYNRRGDLAVAAWAARQLGLPVVEQLDTLMREGFDVSTSLVMTEAALSLAELTPSAPPALRQRVAETLRRAAADLPVPRAPLASAAAAVAAWRLDPVGGRAVLLATAEAESTLAADWLAWHVAAAGGADIVAVERIAGELLAVRYYNNARAAGAMMLALVTRRTAHQAAAMAVMAERFGPDENPYPRDGMLQESYRCALLLLGRSRYARRLEEVLATLQFPHRRVLTAMLLTGNRYGADWLLGRDERTAADVSGLLGNETISEVLRKARPDLPHYEFLATPPVREWQADIIRDAYMLSR